VGNNRVVGERLLDPVIAARILGEIKLAKASSHEVSIIINKAIVCVRQKNTEEAHKLLAEARSLAREDGVRDSRLYMLLVFIALQ
jgi:hypothetical protein